MCNVAPPIYKILDTYLDLFTRRISVIKAIRPVNLAEEKQKFLDSNCNYNPQFEYKPLTISLAKVRNRTEVLLGQIPNSEIGDLYRKRLEENLIVLDLLENIGKDAQKFSELSIRLYGRPEQKFLDMATKDLVKLQSQQPINKGRLLNANEIVDLISEACLKIGLQPKIELVSDPHRHDRISIGKASGAIKIGIDCKKYEDGVRGMIAHEIYTHLKRWHSGSQQTYKIFQYGTAGYLKTEEGLASLNGYEARAGTVMANPAKLLLLIDTALKGSFVDVYRLASTFFVQRRAWLYSVRVKRGIFNTALQGGFTKDQYYAWAKILAECIADDSSLREKLLFGKLGVDDLESKYVQKQLVNRGIVD